ncbi:binding protein [[Candida] boidinii]|nr:binding protein [[Candida] boidinii]OWB86306.1 binding protein [[Candida] boidinii]
MILQKVKSDENVITDDPIFRRKLNMAENLDPDGIIKDSTNEDTSTNSTNITENLNEKEYTDKPVTPVTEDMVIPEGISISVKDAASFHNYIKSKKCRTILALVGSGLSASSGLQTFRGSGGLWKNFSSIDLATPDAFVNDPGLVWQFYTYRRYKALSAKPNNGHKSLAELSKITNKPGKDNNGNRYKKFLTITQNVDGLSQRANHDEKSLIEMHGSLFTLKCTSFLCTYVEKNNYVHPLTEQLKDCEDEFEFVSKDNRNKKRFKQVKLQMAESDLPHCPECGTGLLRPGVVWFGESLPLISIDKADEFIIRNRVDLILVIGTSRSVWPVASYVNIVKNQGGKVAIFNTERDELEDSTVDDDDGKMNNNNDSNSSMPDCWQFIGDAATSLPFALKPLIGETFNE